MNQRFTREGAIGIIQSSAKMIKSGFISQGLPFDLAEAFDLDITNIINESVLNS